MHCRSSDRSQKFRSESGGLTSIALKKVCNIGIIARLLSAFGIVVYEGKIGNVRSEDPN
jgi:hypothetical protein